MELRYHTTSSMF